MSYDFDLFVIGAGSGGVRASRVASSFGARVAICEDARAGGTCVNLGCIPKKILAYGSELGDALPDAGPLGWRLEGVQCDWPALVKTLEAEVTRLSHIYRRVLADAGVTWVEGRGRLVDPHTVEVAGRTYTAAHVLVTTGSRAVVPPVRGAELGITSDGVFSLPELPPRVLIVGGGYIGVELASIFHGFGVHVTLVTRGPEFLSGFDEDLRRHLAETMRKRQIDLRFDCTVASARRDADCLHVDLSTGPSLACDQLIWAVGRAPNTEGLGLEAVGVTLRDGAIPVDAHFTTQVPSISALGDVIDRLQLTPVALAEAMVFARRTFGGLDVSMDYDNVPTAVFSNPAVGTVGLTEAEARARCDEVVIYRNAFRPLRIAVVGRGERTLVKLVVDGRTDRVLGVHMVGPEAGEVIQGFAVALKAGATKAVFDATIGIHPTVAEELVTLRSPAP